MPLRDRIQDWLSNADARALPGVFAAVSIRPSRTVTWLRASGKAFVDPERGGIPDPRDLEETAAWVTQQSRLRMAMVGGLAGLGGLASIPPEAVATVVAALRLAQRLGVVYGFDPATDRGQMAVWQAVAAGFQVDLPSSGALGLRLTELPGVVVGGVSQQATGSLATAVAKQSTFWVARRFSRWFPVPVLSSGLGARAAEKRLAEVGLRMTHTFARLAVAAQPAGDVVDAVEIDGVRTA